MEGPLVLALVLGLVAADPRLRPALAPRAQALSPVEEAGLDLRLASPAPSRPGLLARWDLGHVLSVLGRRPALANGFGSYLDPEGFAEAAGAFSLSPQGFDALLERRRAGLVVAGPATFDARLAGGRTWHQPSDQGAVLDVEAMRALPLSPLLIAGSAVPGAGIGHLEHLLPRFASREVVGGLAFPLPMLWTYEWVPGARLRGRAPPGAGVLAALAIVERGRGHAWKAFTTADGAGRWELVLPVPTSYATPTVVTAPAYQLSSEGGPAVGAPVPEDAVRNGRVIELGAPLRTGRRPAAGATPRPR
jgi:hypothetical protein